MGSLSPPTVGDGVVFATQSSHLIKEFFAHHTLYESLGGNFNTIFTKEFLVFRMMTTISIHKVHLQVSNLQSIICGHIIREWRNNAIV